MPAAVPRNLVSDIAVPCKILFAEDDPIVSCSSLDGLRSPYKCRGLSNKKGGHMGYLGHPQGEKGFHWLDSVLVDWIKKD